MSGKISFLGEFEQIVLLAVVHLGHAAYGATIRREIEQRAGRTVSIGAAYATLDRLVEKGYLRAREESGGDQGRVRRYFTVTPGGVSALEEARDLQRRMWAGIELRRAARKS